MHEADSAYSIRSTWLSYQQVQFRTLAYYGYHCIFFFRLLINSFFIWICPFDSIVPLDVKPDDLAFEKF